MMKGKLVGVEWLAVKRHWAVGNPDTFSIYIHFTGLRATGGFLGTSAWKERPVEQSQFRLPGWIGNDGREEAGIFVVYVAEFYAVRRGKSSKPQTSPVEDIFRYGQGNPRSMGRPCRVGHQVSLKRPHKCDARILAASATIGSPLIIGFRLQCDSKPLDACRIAGFIEAHSCNSYARVISSCDQTRE